MSNYFCHNLLVKNFIISEVFNIYDNAVLPDDMVQTTYSKKKHEWIKKSIEKHEKSLLLVRCGFLSFVVFKVTQFQFNNCKIFSA